LHNESQIKTLFIMVDMCSPVKLILKKMLIMYMEKCDPNHVKQNKKF